MLRHEDHFIEKNGFLAKTKMMNSSDSNPRAKSRSRGVIK
jgi:hypothetical protein